MTNQKGSVAVIALLVLLIFGIMAAGLMPLVTTLTRQAPMNKDVVEAQYAAEAGAKRAWVEFNRLGEGSWDWLGAPKAFLDDVDSKRYQVIIYNADDVEQKPVTPDFTANHTYVVKSVGTVGQAVKTVFVTINVVGGGSGGGSHSNDLNFVTHYVIYSGGNITLKGSYTLHGRIAAKNAINQNGSINADNNSALLPNQTQINWLPDFAVLTAEIADDRLVNNNITTDSQGNVTLSGGNYNNQTIVVNGNLSINNNTNFSNTTLYVTGTVTINGGGINFNNNCYIVAGSNINTNGSINLGGAVFVSYGNIDMGGSGTLNSGAMYANGNVRLNGSFVLTYGQGTVDQNIDFGGAAAVDIQEGSWRVE